MNTERKNWSFTSENDFISAKDFLKINCMPVSIGCTDCSKISAKISADLPQKFGCHACFFIFMIYFDYN